MSVYKFLKPFDAICIPVILTYVQIAVLKKFNAMKLDTHRHYDKKKVMMKSISTSTEDVGNAQARKGLWPFGQHTICKVMEIEMPKFHEPGDFQIVAKNDGIFVEEVNTQGVIFQKLYPGDKILAFDETDYTAIDSLAAYQDATRRIGNVRVVTVSRRQVS